PVAAPAAMKGDAAQGGPSTAESADGDVKSRIEALERELAELKRRQSGEGQHRPTPGGPTRVVPAARDGALPLSSMQERLWVLEEWEGESCAYDRLHAMRISGPLDQRVLSRALDAVVKRHEALRTVFVEADETVEQRIVAPSPLTLHRV